MVNPKTCLSRGTDRPFRCLDNDDESGGGGDDDDIVKIQFNVVKYWLRDKTSLERLEGLVQQLCTIHFANYHNFQFSRHITQENSWAGAGRI